MPTWAKVLLSLIAVVIVLVVASGFFAYRWMMKNKDHFLSVQKEGTTFGTGKDYAQCTDTALARLGGGMTSQIEARLFVEGCLKVAAPTPAICEGAPPKSEIMRSAQWSVEQCRKRGLMGQQGCTQIFQAVAQACQR